MWLARADHREAPVPGLRIWGVATSLANGHLALTIGHYMLWILRYRLRSGPR